MDIINKYYIDIRGSQDAPSFIVHCEKNGPWYPPVFGFWFWGRFFLNSCQPNSLYCVSIYKTTYKNHWTFKRTHGENDSIDDGHSVSDPLRRCRLGR